MNKQQMPNETKPALVSTRLNGFNFSHLTDAAYAMILQQTINGTIINSVPGPAQKQELITWKQTIAKMVFDSRNGRMFSPDNHYTISLSLRFHPPSHHNRKLDVDNFIKPILDGIAAGLFCAIEQDPTQITKFDYDDSNFNRLYIEKLFTDNKAEEGIVITILASK